MFFNEIIFPLSELKLKSKWWDSKEEKNKRKVECSFVVEMAYMTSIQDETKYGMTKLELK